MAEEKRVNMTAKEWEAMLMDHELRLTKYISEMREETQKELATSVSELRNEMREEWHVDLSTLLNLTEELIMKSSEELLSNQVLIKNEYERQVIRLERRFAAQGHAFDILGDDLKTANNLWRLEIDTQNNKLVAQIGTQNKLVAEIKVQIEVLKIEFAKLSPNEKENRVSNPTTTANAPVGVDYSRGAYSR